MNEFIYKMASSNIGSFVNFLKNPKNIKYMEHILNNLKVNSTDLSLSEIIY
jgi:hypothetical protein